ncbi:hypothetical protein AABB24_028039 [Solanum stoloniferum]|uniref:Mediator complex subunit 15 KIX domain-containing protein n=1 Tax=Solanum stoloniferum TaxID=62892 RepID=A0ABD2S6G9_9SOLN
MRTIHGFSQTLGAWFLIYTRNLSVVVSFHRNIEARNCGFRLWIKEFWSGIDMNWNNWRAIQAQAQAQGGGEGSETAAGAMDSGDWRTQLLPDLRQRIGDMIMETLKRHVSVSGQERVQELKEIAVTFEEKIYSTATSQQDYLQKISSKMLIMETRRSQNLIQPNPASSGQNALGRGFDDQPGHILAVLKSWIHL